MAIFASVKLPRDISTMGKAGGILFQDVLLIVFGHGFNAIGPPAMLATGLG
jgi:hypothetical protein